MSDQSLELWVRLEKAKKLNWMNTCAKGSVISWKSGDVTTDVYQGKPQKSGELSRGGGGADELDINREMEGRKKCNFLGIKISLWFIELALLGPP
jgi:hypothetical protein